MSPARDLVVDEGTRVVAQGRFVTASDGYWLDPARYDDFTYKAPEWRSHYAVSLTNVESTAVPVGESRRPTVRVTGSWVGASIEVERVETFTVPERALPRWTTPPCPPPPGGWGRIDSPDNNLHYDIGELETTGAAVTAVTFRPEPGRCVLVVAATDIDAVESALGPQLPGQLCIIRSKWTREQLDVAREHLHSRASDWGIELIGRRCDEQAQAHINVGLVVVTPEIADWAESPPEGLVVLDPAVLPAP